jgi:hypothetical protein
MPKSPSAFRYRKFLQRLDHIQKRRQGLPEGLLEWTHSYFGASRHVQKLLHVDLHDAPEKAASNLIKLQYGKLGIKTLPPKVRR